jgi:UDP-N-acetylglucosamine 3-dehydrogenase
LIKVAVVGVGAMGRHHARIYSQLDGVELVGIADLNRETAEKIAKEYNCRTYTDYKEMILKEKPDAVSIAVPTVHHRNVALFAIEHGLNVLIEKPIAHTVDAAKEIEEKAAEKGVILMVGHIERFNPAIRELKKVIEGGALGEVKAMSARRVGPFTNRITDVGVIVDVGVHDIDIMSYLFNDAITGVYTSAGDCHGATETYAMMMLRFSRGGTGIIETNRLTPRKIRELTVTGTKAVAVADYLEQKLTIHNGGTVQVEVQKVEPLMAELKHFIECVTEKKKPLVNGIEGIHALEVALSSVSSYKNNRYEPIIPSIDYCQEKDSAPGVYMTKKAE